MFDVGNSQYAKVVLFVVFGIILGSVIEFILKTIKLPIPYTVLVFYIGILLAVLRNSLKLHAGSFIEESVISSDLIVYGFLPALLFSETMNLNL